MSKDLTQTEQEGGNAEPAEAGTSDLGSLQGYSLNCRGRIRKAKAKLEQDLARDVENDKKGFCKCIGQKKRPRRLYPPSKQEEWTGVIDM